MSGTLAPQIHYIAPTEVRIVGIDFTDALPSGVLLTGTPTVTADGTLTIGNVAVSTVATIINERTVTIGKAVTCTVSAGVEDTDILLTATAGTNSSPTETLVATCRLLVRK